jgi:tetratricopeptide (TPR) repeat protein
MGDFIEARKVFDEIIRLRPEAPASWQALARFSIDFEVQVKETGIPAALKAVELGGKDAATLTLVGRGFMLLDDHTNAERYFVDALALDQNYAPAHLNLGILYLNTGRSEQAQSHLQAAVLLDGDGASGSQAQQILSEYFP